MCATISEQLILDAVML